MRGLQCAIARSSHHHIALRVADLDRATRFYERVFDGRVVIALDLAPDFVESIFGAPPGARARNRVLDLGGWAIELFEVVPGGAIPRTPQTEAGIMHFCATVDDVAATVELVRAAGGRELFPVRPWEHHHFVYVEDCDGHVIELLDATLAQSAALAREGGVPDHTAEAG